MKAEAFRGITSAQRTGGADRGPSSIGVESGVWELAGIAPFPPGMEQTDKFISLYPDLGRNPATGGKAVRHIPGCGQDARAGGEKRKLCPSPCWDGCSLPPTGFWTMEHSEWANPSLSAIASALKDTLSIQPLPFEI